MIDTKEPASSGNTHDIAAPSVPPLTPVSPLTPLESEDRSGDTVGSGKTSDMAIDLKKLEREMAEAESRAFEAGFQAAIDLLLKHRGAGHAGISKPVSSTVADSAPGLILSDGSNALPRGVTEMIVENILQSVAPRALTPSQILKIGQEREGARLRDSSVGRVLRRLAEKGVAEQVGKTSTWRFVSKPRLVGS